MASRFKFNWAGVNKEFNKLLATSDRLVQFMNEESTKLSKTLAYGYKAQLLRDIRFARWKTPGWKYSFDYAKWKKEKGGGLTRYWRLSETLFSSIDVYEIREYQSTKRKHGYAVGVPDTAYGPRGWNMKGSIPVYVYLHWLEYGRRGQPPRPVFYKSYDSFMKKSYPNLLSAFKAGMVGIWKS